jgi:MoxR-like ATPase
MPTPFDLIALAQNKQSDELITALKQRSHAHSDLKQAAQFFCLHDDLKEVINTAIAVGEPLILTGEAGTGKTHSA